MSAMSFALKHYENAPLIGLLKSEKFEKMTESLMKDMKTEKSIEEIIIFHHKQDTLNVLMGDLLIKEYKKDNPKKQSVFSSDVARLNFIIKDVIGENKKSQWITDKKGVKFTVGDKVSKLTFLNA